MNLGICVGHSRRGSGANDGKGTGDMGAVSLWGESEWDYNSKVAVALKAELDRRDIASFILDDYQASGYSTGIRRAARMLRDNGATHTVELHFNAATPSANGAEWLHWHNSRGGKALAQALHKSFKEEFPEITDRGLKPRHPGQRGTAFLRTTHCPAVIVEPFFGSNTRDCQIFRGAEDVLAATYAEGISRL